MFDYVLWARSLGTGREFPVYVFSGDTDMPTEGKAALVSRNGPEIVLTEMTAEEWNCPDAAEGAARCERRINAALGRNDLRIIRLTRCEDTFDGRGLSFQEYQARYTPPRLFYRDIFDSEGEAEIFRDEESVEDFQTRGGTIRWVR